jgi:hypothetical protein
MAVMYRSLFASGQFRVLLAGTLMYGLGFTFEILGLSVLVYAETRSSFAAALAFGAGFAPQVVGGALFGSLADRLPPRLAITGGLLVRAMPGLAIGLAPSMPVPVMLGLVAATAMTAPVFSAAIARVLAAGLDGDRYVLARSVLDLTIAGTQILGLGLGGLILAVLPPRTLLLAAGSCVAASALIRTRVRPPTLRVEKKPRGGNELRGVVRTSVTGNARLLADPRLRGLLLAYWLPPSMVTGAEALIVPYAGRSAGVLLAASPAGMMAGEVVVGRFCRARTQQRLAFPLAVLTGAPLIALLAHPPLIVTWAMLFCCGAGFGYQIGTQRAFLDAVPADLRGQGFALRGTGVMAGQGLTPPLTGALSAVTGPASAMALAGVGDVLIALWLRGALSPPKVLISRGHNPDKSKLFARIAGRSGPGDDVAEQDGGGDRADAAGYRGERDALDVGHLRCDVTGQASVGRRVGAHVDHGGAGGDVVGTDQVGMAGGDDEDFGLPGDRG